MIPSSLPRSLCVHVMLLLTFPLLHSPLPPSSPTFILLCLGSTPVRPFVLRSDTAHGIFAYLSPPEHLWSLFLRQTFDNDCAPLPSAAAAAAAPPHCRRPASPPPLLAPPRSSDHDADKYFRPFQLALTRTSSKIKQIALDAIEKLMSELV